MKAIVSTGQDIGLSGLQLMDRPMPEPAINDVIVKVHAASITGDELSWPSTWVDRTGKERLLPIPGHELSGIVTELGYGTTGLSVGQRVFGLTDWHRDGSLAEYVAVESRNLTGLPADIDFVTGTALVMPGLTSWQGLFDHGQLKSGQTVLIHGAAGIVGSMAVQLAKIAGAFVIGTGRASGREIAKSFGVDKYVDLETEKLNELEAVDLVFDVFGGEIAAQSASLVKNGGKLVTIAGPTDAFPFGGLTIDFVVEANTRQLDKIAKLWRQGRLKTNIGNVSSLDDAISNYNSDNGIKGKKIVQIEY